ncbi:MAG TPA: hypothetical protein DCO83_12735 [Mucilaginibacter sp.]|jgi:hypothetical protein|nr:hypothetical protein [Mucilaginibacter sp.]
MDPEFITYQKFNDPALANDLAELLAGNHIEYQVEEATSGFDASMVMSNAPVDYAVKIQSEDFEKVNQLLKESERRDVEAIGKDYYLFAFTDDELMEVVTKADEWSSFDVVLARKLLAERGKSISDEEISKIHESRIVELKEPEPPQALWIIVGYILAFGGGVLGLFIGWHLSTYKKTLPDGERVYGYTENDRKHGKRIFFLSFIGLAIAFAVKLSPVFESN